MDNLISIGKTEKDLIKPKPKFGRPKVAVTQLVDRTEYLTCPCGMSVRRDNLSQHKKCNVHKTIMQKLQDSKLDEIQIIETELNTIDAKLKSILIKLQDEKFKVKLKYN